MRIPTRGLLATALCAMLLAGCAAPTAIVDRVADDDPARLLEQAGQQEPAQAARTRLEAADILARQGEHTQALEIAAEIDDGLLPPDTRARWALLLADLGETLGEPWAATQAPRSPTPRPRPPASRWRCASRWAWRCSRSTSPRRRQRRCSRSRRTATTRPSTTRSGEPSAAWTARRLPPWAGAPATRPAAGWSSPSSTAAAAATSSGCSNASTPGASAMLATRRHAGSPPTWWRWASCAAWRFAISA